MVDDKFDIDKLIEIRSDPDDGTDQPSENPQIYYADDLIALYTAFRDRVYNPQSVLYPSCGFDASPARVFDNVTFVDVEQGNEGCIRGLQEAGLQALKQDIRDYQPKRLHDLLILLNPSIPSEWATRHLRQGGYIIANDYHSNATQINENPEQFTLWGTMDFAEKDRRKGDFRVIVSRDLDDLFQPVNDADEFKRLRPEDFDFTKTMVLSFVDQGIVIADKDAPFEEKWAAYRDSMREGMPYKRVAERYIFVKK